MSDANQITKLLDEAGAERRKGLMIRRAIVLATLLMVLLFIGNIYVRANNFDSDSFIVHLQGHATRTVWPTYERELSAVAADAVPAITGALQAESAALLPRVSERLVSEAEVFQRNMGDHMKAALDRDVLTAAEAHKADLKDRFPHFSEDAGAYEDLMRRLQASCRGWAQGQLDTTFQKHVLLLQSINETVQVLQVQASAERAATGDRSMEDVLVIMAEIMNARVAGEG